MKKNRGYTLIEITLIIIITSLILGGLISLKYTFNKVKIFKTIQEINKIKQAVNTFYIRFGSLPGDVKNSMALNITKVNTDGNENGLLGMEVSENTSQNNFDNELFYFWIHLYNSGLLTLKNNSSILPSIYINPSKYYSVFSYNGNNFLQLGAEYPKNTNFNFSNDTLTPAEAFIIERKIDDSLPNSGKMQASGGTTLNKIVDKNNISAYCSNGFEYIVKQNNKTCQLTILLD